jgi:hypothetical protein
VAETTSKFQGILEQLKKIVKDSEIMKEDDRNWPMPDKVGRQELEARISISSLHIIIAVALLLHCVHGDC